MDSKKIFSKENLKPIAVLLSICIVVALLLGVINMFTAPEILRRQQAAADAAKKVVLPDGENFVEIEITDAFPEEISAGYKSDAGYVFETSVKGKEPGMIVMCGISAEGKVVGVEVIADAETPSYKEKVFPLVVGLEGAYKDMDSSTLEAEVVTGATLTSNAIYKAVKASLDAYTVAGGGELAPSEETLPKTDEEIASLSATLMGVSVDDLVNVTPEESGDHLKRVFKDKNGKGYAAYIVVMSTHYEGQVETETLVHIGLDSTIKGINKLQWNVSAAAPDWGYNPPSADEVTALYGELVGKNSETIDSVDLATGATNTTTAMVGSVKEALEVVEGIIDAEVGENYLPRIIGIVVLAVGVLGFVAYIVIPKIISRRKTK